MPEAGSARVADGRLIPGFRIVAVAHDSGPRTIYRAVSDAGEDVILKTLRAQYPRKEDAAELRREFRILERLNAPGVIRARSLRPYGAGNVAIELEPYGRSLAEVLAERSHSPLPVHRVIPLAVRLIRALDSVHEHDLVHKNLAPGSVLVNSDLTDLRLIDFRICSELSRERPNIRLGSRIEGPLPYLSPEQTGRTGRALDYRSDYYSLGVVLFELLTGTLPFTARDPLEWIHRHISQVPSAAHEINPELPPALSAIVAKLLAKSAEERYQSGRGILFDLERCEKAASARSGSFEPGQADIPRNFQIPERLYGREAEIDTLQELFEGVAHGATQVCLISGAAGIGKSALVAELGRSIVRERGYLVEGKFDQYKQSAAYGGIAQAMRALVDQLLGEPADRLERWRADLQEALGANAALIADLVPRLDLILGDLPPVAQLPPTEAQNRFQIVFLNFIKVFTARQHPLVIFLDDLQWSDIPTLTLLGRLATARDIGRVFLIGAYRTNAVDAMHPLALTLDEIRKVRHIVELSLGPLDDDAVDRLTAETVHADVDDCRSLSRGIRDKAHGNPFFIREVLKRLHETGAIHFEAAAGRWTWDMAQVRTALVGENVLEFMVATLRRLPERTQAALQFAACIGNTFDLRTLSLISSRNAGDAALDLHDALVHEMVVPLGDAYKFVALDQAEVDANATYRFQHDRIQQAAYELIEPERRQSVHLSIGRIMERHVSPEELDEGLIDIVGHLNAGRELIEAERERKQLAEMNLLAGRKAAGSSAYAAALGFLRIGQELLGAVPWDLDFDLMLALSREVQQCAYLTADHAAAEAWATTILERSRTPLEKAEVLSARTRQFSTMGRPRDSIQAAFHGLALLGFAPINDPTSEDIDREMKEVEKQLAGRDVGMLIEAAEVTSGEARIAIRILMEVFPAAFLSGSGNLFPYLVLKSVSLSLRFGSSPESAFSYAAYGMLLCGALNDPALGYQYGRLGVAMNERFDDIALRARVIYVYAMFVHHWSNHWASMTPWFLKGIAAGYQAGDLLYLAYSAQDCVIWDPTLDLATATREQRKYLAIVEDCRYQDSYDSGTLFLQMQLNFLGLTESTFSMNDTAFDETRCVDGMRSRRFMTGIANYHIYKAEIHAFYGDYAGALEHVRIQDGLIASAMSLPQLVRFYIIAFLTRAALFQEMEAADQRTTLERLQADLRQMTLWARHCPENFKHLRLTMEAELARLENRLADAVRLYDAAAGAARSSGFLRDEAVANELAARCLLAHGLSKAAEGYLRAAHHLYDRWGARRKVDQLEAQYPMLLDAAGANRPARASGDASTASLDSSNLDVHSVIKASQTISGELVLDRLLNTTLQITLENAGGQRGFLLVRDDGRLVLRAQAYTDPNATPLPLPLEVTANAQPPIPFTVVNNVLRSGAPVVLNDASSAARFASDPYIVSRRPRSVLCLPIQRGDRFSGAIYMENNLTTGAFSEDRVEVVRLLAVQAAISIENASLYAAQVRLTEAQRRFVPTQFLSSLGHADIAKVGLGEFVSREMSVLFADLREFTPLAERLGPDAVIALLNRYFSRVGEPIAEAGGFVDSYNGDEIMALFPLPAERAVEAAVQMRLALADFNRLASESGGPVLEMGIGINTGPLVLGTVGSHDRLKCGVVGDTVNTAKRVEQLTRHYRTPLLVGDHTFTRIQRQHQFSTRVVDCVAVKGKMDAITLYEVLDGESPARRRAKEATRDLLDAGRRLYGARDFAGAARAFDDARRLDPADRVLDVLGDRARHYAAHPPPAEWQGYEVLTEK